MRLYNYLTGGRSIQISEDECLSILKSKHKNSWKMFLNGKTTIWRGFLSRMNYGYVQPSQFTRKSAHTSNYYTLLVDYILPSWKKYPKRSKSIICTTDKLQASRYGFGYAVIPEDGSKIGICPDSDFWFSFEELYGFGIRIMDEFNTVLMGFAQEVLDDVFDDRNPEKMKKQLKEIDVLLKNMSDRDLKKLQNNMFSKYGKFALALTIKQYPVIKQLDDYMDPDSNNFSIGISGKDSIPNKKEVWTDGNCILIDEEILSEFQEKIQ